MACIGLGTVSQSLHAGVAYDFSEVDAIATGALTGQNITSPVSGFELLIVKDGEIVYRRSLGNWSLDRVGNADSATKTMSDAVIASLAYPLPGQTSLPFSLDTRLSTYFPQFTGEKAAITIRQAFCHTSGIRASSLLGSTTLTLQQAAQTIATSLFALNFSPGTAFSYGGTSMHVAGAAAELAAQTPWNTLFQQRITGPLGLTQTTFVLSSPTNPRIAGGCNSTALDFVRLMEMIRRRGLHATPTGDVRVLSEAAVDAILTRQSGVGTPIVSSPLSGSSDYGIGIWLDRRNAQGAVTGALAMGARGFSAWVDLDDGMSGAVATDLSNAQNVLGLTNLIRAAAERAIRAGVDCIGDFNNDGGITGDDIAAFFTAYECGAASSDVNQDGGVTGDDIAAFFTAYQAGC